MKLLWPTVLLTLSSFVAGFHDHRGRFLAGRAIQNGVQHAGLQPSSEVGSIGIQPADYRYSEQTAHKRWVELQHLAKMRKRMLSQGLKKQPSLSSMGYSGKKLTSADVQAIHKAAQEIVHQLSTVSSPLVLFMGNSPSYLFEALSAHDISAYNIHNVAISGGLSHITPDLAQKYVKNVLSHVMNKPFKQVVLVDIYGTGNSKEEFARLLSTCEDTMKLAKHTLKPVQIPIIDSTQAKPRSAGVPFLGPPVVIGVPGLAKGLTDGMYPRLIANYATQDWDKTPEFLAQKAYLDNLGRIEVVKALRTG